jgi:hypothetical protein
MYISGDDGLETIMFYHMYFLLGDFIIKQIIHRCRRVAGTGEKGDST